LSVLIRLTRRRSVLFAAVAALAVAGGVAYAATPDGEGNYYACKLRSTGTIRLIDKSLAPNLLGRCSLFEEEISWHKGGGTPVLAEGSVDGVAVLDDSLTSDDLNTGSVRSDEILDGTVQTSDIGDGAVRSEDVLDGSIRGEDISTGDWSGITGANVQNNSLTSDDLASASVQADELAPGAVTRDDIRDAIGVGAVVTATTTLPGAPVPVPAGTRSAIDVPVPGISVGDFVSVSPPGSLNDDLIFTGGTITGNDTVTVYVYNPTAGSLAADGTWTINWIDKTN
jgi:hypothetical protein